MSNKTLRESVTIDEFCGCGTMHVIITHEGEEVKRVDAHLGKMGTCPKVLTEALTKLITIGLEYGVPLKEVIKAVNNHHCSRFVTKKGTTWSCSDAIAKALKEFTRQHSQH